MTSILHHRSPYENGYRFCRLCQKYYSEKATTLTEAWETNKNNVPICPVHHSLLRCRSPKRGRKRSESNREKLYTYTITQPEEAKIG